MNYVYHRKSKNMTGPILYPLNELKTLHPAIFESEKSKYQGREELMDETVPLLDCKWNDVIHLSPIDPKYVYQTLVYHGFIPDKSLEWYKIPTDSLTEAKTVIYLFERGKTIVESFSKDLLKKMGTLPISTQEYYAECAKTKKRPFLFHQVPHILTQAQIDISEFETIKWST